MERLEKVKLVLSIFLRDFQEVAVNHYIYSHELEERTVIARTRQVYSEYTISPKSRSTSTSKR